MDRVAIGARPSDVVSRETSGPIRVLVLFHRRGSPRQVVMPPTGSTRGADPLRYTLRVRRILFHVKQTCLPSQGDSHRVRSGVREVVGLGG